MNDPVFLDVDDVLWIHDRQLDLFGLESAVALPQQTFDGEFLHPDIYTMAAAYAFHIAENQPFVDGNKRTALEACLVFLDFNEIVLLDSDGRLYDAMIAIARGELDKVGLAALLRRLSSAMVGR